MQARIWLLAGLVVLIGLMGCNETSGSVCEADSDCAQGEACFSGTCQVPPGCVIDRDCPYASYCLSGTCTPASVCSSWEDCEEGYDCVEGTCRPFNFPLGCQSDEDCDSSQYCETDSGICLPKTNPDGDQVPDGDRVDGDAIIDGDKPDGDTVPDGDIAPDGDVADGDITLDGDTQVDGDMDYGNLCKPCSSATECNPLGGDMCLTDQSGQSFCARLCDIDHNPCPSSFICEEIFGSTVTFQCRPETGFCSDMPDGDVPDGDAADGDQPDGDAVCSGACVSTMNDICYGDSLCRCVNSTFTLTGCAQICAQQGSSGFSGCGYDNTAGEDICHCTGTVDGDVAEDYCPGYSGANSCCAPSNPCGLDNDDWCDCGGACSWEASDCAEPTMCPGYSGASYCCALDDPCDYGADGICDCEGACSWDDSDCNETGEGQCGLCQDSTDCLSGFKCISYTGSDLAPFCVKDCTGGLACPSGSSCYQNRCIPTVTDAWCVTNDLHVIDSCDFEDTIACTDGSEVCNAQDLSCDPLTTDGDVETEPCTGACSNTDPLVCLDSDTLCACESGQLQSFNCQTICTDAGYDFAVECGDNPDTDGDVCFCDYDIQSVGTCADPIEITSLPFMHTSTTIGLSDNYSGEDCDDVRSWGGENVYHIVVTNEAPILDIFVETSVSGYDIVLTVRQPCNTNPNACSVIDAELDGETESVALDFGDFRGDFYIMVDGYGSADVGAYTILVRKHVE
jgi:hypothetical protein